MKGGKGRILHKLTFIEPFVNISAAAEYHKSGQTEQCEKDPDRRAALFPFAGGGDQRHLRRDKPYVDEPRHEKGGENGEKSRFHRWNGKSGNFTDPPQHPVADLIRPDDLRQPEGTEQKFPDFDGGANDLSLKQYRKEYHEKIKVNPNYRWDKNK